MKSQTQTRPGRALADGSIQKNAVVGKGLLGGFPCTQGELDAGCEKGAHGRGTCDVTDIPGPAGFGLRILSPYVTGAGLTKVTIQVCVTKARSLDSALGVSPQGSSLQSHGDRELGRQQGRMARPQPTDSIDMALEISCPGHKCPGAHGG